MKHNTDLAVLRRPFWRLPFCLLQMCGGHVERDASNRINWRCATCGRWSNPVAPADELVVINSALRNHLSDEDRRHG